MKLCKGVALALTASYGLTYCHTTKSKLTLEQQGDSLTVIHITNPTNYILLPIEEEAPESQVLQEKLPIPIWIFVWHRIKWIILFPLLCLAERGM